MNSSETHSNEAEEIDKDDAVLPQIGEDPGLPADTLEQDSKAMDHNKKRQGKGSDRTKTMENH